MLNSDSVNKVILMGIIDAHPFWNRVEGVRMLFFSVITIEKIKRHGGYQEHTERHQVRISERQATPADINIGGIVYVQGRLQTRQIVDQDGIKHYKAEIVANSVEPVGIKLQSV